MATTPSCLFTELFFIIEGVATIEVGGVIHRAPPGTTVLVPPGACRMAGRTQP